MRSKPFVILAIITLLVIIVASNYSTVWAQGDDPKTKIVTISDTTTAQTTPRFSKHLVVFDLKDNLCDTLRFDNTCSYSVRLLNDETPNGLPSKTPGTGGDLITNGDQRKYPFCCPTDAGTWRFMVGKAAKEAIVYTDTLKVVVSCRQTPSLTEWGLIILVALLIGSTVFIMLRRRKAAVPA